jgi:D-glycero-D-manno-heptose 1,7-bisphosphate phosphatase
VSDATVQQFHQSLALQLAHHNIEIQKIYYCPHHPDYTGPCECRKPNPGLALQAAKEFSIDLTKSIFVGDKDNDILLGKNCGGKTAYLRNTHYPHTIPADHDIDTLKDLYDILKPY